MRGTAAYKFRNRFVFGVVAFGLGLGAVMNYFVDVEKSRLFVQIKKNQEWRDETLRRQQQISQLKALEKSRDKKPIKSV
ncbi:Hypothetical predicted protein [Mytilus galloprovincialis]|uniref:Uncharacterized protein n=1 Tax=Mytilus galloprovincialis TaxID=29158 RepID=A0A8B6DR98_MYTGA|nr:Hypothetical predicted protein [Mytilus galloprovincialis]